MSVATDLEVRVYWTGHRAPEEGYYQRYDTEDAAREDTPRKNPSRQLYFRKGATFPPDSFTFKRSYFRFVAAR